MYTMEKRMNKKGFELIWSNVVVIILAFMLLLVIILFFTNTSGGFAEKIKGYFSYSNVDFVIDSCNLLSNSDSEYAFCCDKKQVKYYENTEKKKGEFSCGELVNKVFINNKINQMGCEGIVC